MAKICYVVHRYAPFPGGSEYFVQHMAEETLRRGHDVTVFTGRHLGDLHGIKVTSTFDDNFDLVVVHGGDVPNQDIIHLGSYKSPVLYQIIKPSNSYSCMQGLKKHQFLGWSTIEDLEHIAHHDMLHKAVNIRHGMNFKDRVLTNKNPDLFKLKYNIDLNKHVFLSMGGFYPHKAMSELANTFNAANLENTVLVLMGYDVGDIPRETENIIIKVGAPEEDVLLALAAADLYIMNSYEEGFGLVLLEAMMNKVPWAARNIAGAKLMKNYGFTYNTQKELIDFMQKFSYNKTLVDDAYNYVIKNHLIQNTVDDIEGVLWKM